MSPSSLYVQRPEDLSRGGRGSGPILLLAVRVPYRSRMFLSVNSSRQASAWGFPVRQFSVPLYGAARAGVLGQVWGLVPGSCFGALFRPSVGA